MEDGLSLNGDFTPIISNFRQAAIAKTAMNVPDGFRINLSDAWGVVHTGSEFAPAHYRQPVALYLGNPAEV